MKAATEPHFSPPDLPAYENENVVARDYTRSPGRERHAKGRAFLQGADDRLCGSKRLEKIGLMMPKWVAR
jgi:hypothetical protein